MDELTCNCTCHTYRPNVKCDGCLSRHPSPASFDDRMPFPKGGDHDEPYMMKRTPTTRAPFPFTDRQLARLLVVRARFNAQKESA